MKRLLALASVLLCSCVSQPATVPASGHAELQAESSVTVKDPSFKPKSGDSIAWLQSLTWVGLNPEADVSQWTDLIQTTVNDQLDLKGFEVKADAGDYQILAFIVMGELADHPDLQALFRLYPDVGTSAEGREHGTLIMALLPSHSGDSPAIKTAWRGAVQIFQARDNELASGQTEQRVEIAIEHLMSSIPTIEM